jgi:hypothetical protein
MFKSFLKVIKSGPGVGVKSNSTAFSDYFVVSQRQKTFEESRCLTNWYLPNSNPKILTWLEEQNVWKKPKKKKMGIFRPGGDYVAPGKNQEKEEWVFLDQVATSSRMVTITLIPCVLLSQYVKKLYPRPSHQKRASTPVIPLIRADWYFSWFGKLPMHNPISKILSCIFRLFCSSSALARKGRLREVVTDWHKICTSEYSLENAI